MAEVQPIKVFCRKCHAKLDVTDLEPFSQVACPDCGTLLRVPLRFERYLLEKVCGIGGMSRVYRAIEPDLARRVAVKIENSDFAEADGGRCFLEEAKLVAKINHPGVIPIYNCGVYDGQPFLAMRYMERGSLEQRLRAGMMPEDVSVTLGWIAVVAEGLEFALRERIVHHDVKPGNILMTASDEPKLGDFDLADVRDTGDSLTLCDGWGSPGYVSPERLLYGGEDFHGDVFSLGVTIYELLTGKMPFGVRGTPEELLERRREGLYPRLSELEPRCPAEVSALVDRMLSYVQEQRPEYPEIIAVLRGAAKNVQSPCDSPTVLGKLAGWFGHGEPEKRE